MLIRVWADPNANGQRDPDEALAGSQQLKDSDRSWKVPVKLDPDSVNLFVVTATNDAKLPEGESLATAVPAISHGASGALRVPFTWVFPPSPRVTQPSAPVVVNAGVFVVGGVASFSSLVRVWVDANVNGRKDRGEPLAGTQQLGFFGGPFSISVPLRQNTANHFVVTGTSLGILESAATPVPVISEDSTPPAFSEVADSPDPFSPNGDGAKDTTTISYRLSTAAAVVLRMEDPSGTGVRTIVEAAREAGLHAEPWDGRDVGGAVVADGAYTYRLDATNGTGTAAAQQTGTVTIDTTGPTVSVTSPQAGAATSDRTLTADASDPNGVAVVQFQHSGDGGANWTDTAAPVTSSPFTAGLLASLADDVYEIRALATDQAGNQVTSASVTVTLDTTAPAAPTGLVAADSPDDAGASWTCHGRPRRRRM